MSSDTVTITSTSGTTLAWPPSRVCASCGGYIAPVAWWGIIPPRMCTCATTHIPGLYPGEVHIAPDFDDPLEFGPARAAWICPRCKAVNAPHVDRCDCRESA